jgi:hypothetical protein
VCLCVTKVVQLGASGAEILAQPRWPADSRGAHPTSDRMLDCAPIESIPTVVRDSLRNPLLELDWLAPWTLFHYP